MNRVVNGSLLLPLLSPHWFGNDLQAFVQRFSDAEKDVTR